MSGPAYPSGAAVAEESALLARNIRTGSRLWAAAQAFFFMAFLFAFFYLRALNSNDIWRGWPPHKPTPSAAFGVLILVCVLAAAAVALVGSRLRPALWRATSLAALVLCVLALVLQAVQFASLGFGPTDGGYASVFVGWTGTFTVFLLGTAYWLGTIVSGARAEQASLVRVASAEAVAFVLLILAGVELAAFILLYLVV